MSVTPFQRPVKTSPTLMRVIDIKSPFFAWEGYLITLAQGQGEGPYVQISCSYNGLQFPALTFCIDQLIPVVKVT